VARPALSRHYRFSLDSHCGRHIDSKTEAETLAELIRVAIRSGTFGRVPEPATPVTPASHTTEVTLEQLGMRWMKHERVDRVQTARDEGYRLKQLCAMVTAESTALGQRHARSVTEDDIESAFDVLRQRGYAASTINHYVQTVKSLEQWAVRKGHLLRPWLTTGTSVRRKKHAQRNRRLHPDVVNAKDVVTEPGEEKRLLEAANPWMQRLIIAALDTGCRRGELLALQWADVSLAKGELTIRAENAKTKRRRVLPISPRLRGVLVLMQTGPEGKEWPPHAYVFGNEIGERVGDPKTAWQVCVLRAHGYSPTYRRDQYTLDAASRAAYRDIDLHFHDLRHEAGSRLLEAGWPLHHVKDMLGHTNIATTGTYLNVTTAGLAESMRRFGTSPVLQTLQRAQR
jgi:integrase